MAKKKGSASGVYRVTEIIGTSAISWEDAARAAVETAAEHLIATHVHDNRRRDDEHLVPYLGSINWDLALMTMQKIGYDGTYLMELATAIAPAQVLEDAQRVRQRFERTLAHP